MNATERVNRSLKTAIRAYVGNKHTAWDRYLPQICFALRTALHESTGHSPSMLLYGRELNTPNCDGMDEPGIPYPESLESSIREAHDHARSVLSESRAKRKKYYDQRRRSVSYSVDELVRVKTHPRSDALANFTAKLAPVYTGPYRITQKLSEVNYRLVDVKTGADAGVFHVANLLPFRTWDSRVETETVPADGSAVEATTDSSLLNDMTEETSSGSTAMNLTDLQIEDEYSRPVTTSVHDLSGSVDSVGCFPDLQVDSGTQDDDLTVDNDLDRHHYDLRPRRAPRITSDWSTNSEAPADVELNIEKHRGKLKDRDVTVINTPHLLRPNLSITPISQGVKECVNLSAPGPHVIILVLQQNDFSDNDRHRVKYVLNEFSEEALKPTIVLTDEEEINSNCIHQLIKECGGGHLQFDERKSGLDSEVLKRVEKILKENLSKFCWQES
ncbi:GTPase IMAP family member 1 [Anabarilius grahami]|uniref:GTPase IMAP family member 1 n=1 Tax=Anabarilius grahami TaxID=495550 RepID=A0A3N0XNB7_ANAGA|nr:GTPase IMAP family member 1 [Anabarilius grahami]